MKNLVMILFLSIIFASCKNVQVDVLKPIDFDLKKLPNTVWEYNVENRIQKMVERVTFVSESKCKIETSSTGMPKTEVNASFKVENNIIYLYNLEKIYSQNIKMYFVSDDFLYLVITTDSDEFTYHLKKLK